MRLHKKESVLPLLILSITLIIIMVIMMQLVESANEFSYIYTILLVVSIVCFILLLGLVGYYITQLVVSVRRQRTGAKLNARMVLFFAGLSFFPLIILFIFSILMVSRGIDSWFDESLDKGFDDALSLAQSALDTRRLDALRLTQYSGERLSRLSPLDLSYQIENIRAELNAQELTIFDLRGNFIATSSGDLTKILPERPNEIIMLSVVQGMEYVRLEPLIDGQLRIRVVIRMPGSNAQIIQAFYEIPERYTELGNSTQKSVEHYKQYKALRHPFKINLIALLSMVALLSILLAFGGSFFAARRLVNPIRKLSIATKAVADGDLTRNIRVKSNDEIGFLTHSFNEMTRKLRLAHDTAQDSQRMLETQRAHLASVLAKLSSGVLVIDMVGRVRTYNNAVLSILKIDKHLLNQVSFRKIEDIPAALESFAAPILPHLVEENEDWRLEITRFYDGAQQILSVRGAQQKDQLGLKGGYIIVFDDITHLINSERESAWSEVARRLAHEIKNPLTPIQLSAERLRLRFLEKMVDKDKEVIDKSTQTIIAQVTAMKEMVDEFSQYARAPKLTLDQVELNALVRDVLYLYYQDYPIGIEIELALSPEPTMVMGDNIRLRQLLHNLVKNALEACQQDSGKVIVATIVEGDKVRLEVSDTGIGFDEDLMSKIFEPYVTTKAKGTGLGLSIVKKIVEEHNGTIAIYSSPSDVDDVGTRVVVQLPLVSNQGVLFDSNEPMKPINLKEKIDKAIVIEPSKKDEE